MKIYPPTLTRQNGMTRYAARVETERVVPTNPETIWFEFPSEYDDWLFPGMDPFVAAMFPLASLLGENI